MVKIKIKASTQEMIGEIASRLNVTPGSLQNEFRAFWQDMDTIINHNVGYSFEIDRLCSYWKYNTNVGSQAKQIEKDLMKYHKTMVKLNAKESEGIKINTMTTYRELISKLITKIVFLHCSIKEYEKNVLSQYPKKYKFDRKTINAVISRLEVFYNIPISKFPVTIYYPIQKVYMQKLRKQGLLPNPIYDKDYFKNYRIEELKNREV